MPEIDFGTKEGRDIYRHSTSHVMAQAVLELFAGTKLGIGPSIQDGFYYDFDLPDSISDDDLPKIEKRMQEIIKQDLPFEKSFISREEARDLFKDVPYKLELLEKIEDEQATLYRQGDFVDLCRGPHLLSTGCIKAFKLTSLAGAYWRGDERRPMLTRIYGTSFPAQEELDEHLRRLEEAKRRDHRKLGPELGLFRIYEEAGAGLIYYLPKGTTLRKIITSFLSEEHLRRGYQEVTIPHIAKEELWQRSGHTEYYRENMYFVEVEKKSYVLKPMNCPGHILIYQTQIRSYKEMPIRYFELGTVYRHERSGVLHGLLRVRGFTQDDAHIFCRPDQLSDEIEKAIGFALDMLSLFGFSEFEVYLSTRPEKFTGSLENWERAETALKEGLLSLGLNYEIDPGEGVFYGPKIDIKLKDALGRSWQGPTIQVDFNLPERFDVAYIGEDGKPHRPVMIHRVVLGSLERFMGALIEHYGGAFPVWLAPVQVVVLTIADRQIDYARGIYDKLFESGIRVETDFTNEKVSAKILKAQMQKIPYMLIIGDKEIERETVNLRSREGERGEIKLEELVSRIDRESCPVNVSVKE